MRMGPGKGDGVGKWYSFLLGRLNKVMKGRGRLDRGIPSVGGIEGLSSHGDKIREKRIKSDVRLNFLRQRMDRIWNVLAAVVEEVDFNEVFKREIG